MMAEPDGLEILAEVLRWRPRSDVAPLDIDLVAFFASAVD